MKFKKNKLDTVVIAIIITFYILILFSTSCVKASEYKNVLILNSYNQGFKWTSNLEKGIESKLKNKENINLYYEFMDMKNEFMEDSDYLKLLCDLYKKKYKNINFDVIICPDDDALNFIITHKKHIFNKCPVVFCGINNFNYSMIKDTNNYTGVIEEIDVDSTINSILKLQPNTENIIIICDSTTTGKINESKVKKAVNKFKDKHNINFYFYRDISAKEINNNINNLGKNTVLLDVAQLRDDKGKTMPYEKTKIKLSKLNKPVYVCWDFLIENDIIGGKVIGGYDQGKIAGEMAYEVLKGRKVSTIPIVKKCPSKFVFNYNGLKKYNIDINKIPENYKIINEPFSFYQTYKKIIWIVVIIIFILFAFIVVLSINIKKRVDTEKKLRENYEELSATEEKNRILAYYDKLTTLPNRLLFSNTLEEKIKKAKQDNSKVAILFIDLDNFKRVNDTLGHNYGDSLLKNISKKLHKLLTKDETVCRLGGDEFLMLQANVKSIEKTKRLAENILKIFYKPFYVHGKQIFITASIGISLFPEDGKEANSLLKNSDTAMYKAKETGKNKYLFYDINMFKEVMRKAELEKGLRNAIKRDELKLVYQPQIDVCTKKVLGAETLLRWTNKEIGSVSPMEFIPLAEEMSFINSIGKWVLKNACLKSKEWLDKGFRPITIAINVSVIQLQCDGFVQNLKDVLQETKLPPKYLELEITESVVMNYVKRNLDILNEIKNMGVKIALDDFGTGYSSLSYLRVLPIDNLKLDKSFIDRIHVNENDKAIADGIIQLAHTIGLTVIAEGVEIKEQYDILKSIGCDQIQGYYFSKPIEYEEFEEKYLKQ